MTLSVSALRTGTTAVVLAATIAGCGSVRTPPDSSGSTSGGVSATSSTVDAPNGGTRQSANPNVTFSAHSSSAIQTSSRSGSQVSTSSTNGPAAATPLQVGQYAYDTSGTMTVSGQTHQLPPTTTLTAAMPQSGSQLQTRDLRGSDGTGQVVAQTLRYDAAGVSLAEVRISTYPGGGVSDVRDLLPVSASRLARTGAQPGDHESFTMQGSGVTAAFTVDVQPTESVVAGGTAVTAAVVQVDVHFSGALTGQQTSTLWVTPAHLQVVKEQVSSNVSNGVLTVQFDYTATLHALQPS